MLQNLLILCVGNICRSPMAEGLFKQRLSKFNPDIDVSSAGVGALIDHAAAIEAQNLANDHAIDLSDHRARQVDTEMIQKADLILVMESDQKKYVENLTPFARGRTFLLGHWDNDEIIDPYMKTPDEFYKAWLSIDRACAKWQSRF